MKKASFKLKKPYLSTKNKSFYKTNTFIEKRA